MSVQCDLLTKVEDKQDTYFCKYTEDELYIPKNALSLAKMIIYVRKIYINLSKMWFSRNFCKTNGYIICSHTSVCAVYNAMTRFKTEEEWFQSVELMIYLLPTKKMQKCFYKMKWMSVQQKENMDKYKKIVKKFLSIINGLISK